MTGSKVKTWSASGQEQPEVRTVPKNALSNWYDTAFPFYSAFLHRLLGFSSMCARPWEEAGHRPPLLS